MADRFEGNFKGAGEAELFFQLWKAKEPRGTMVVTHGLAEHSECYQPLASVLTKSGWDVYAWDLRGHGRSEGKRGYVANFSEFEIDLCEFIRLVKSQMRTEGRLVLFGHSLGGLINLKTIVTHGDFSLTALALSSPALGLAVEVPKLKQKMAEWAARFLPTLTLWNEVRYENLTRDAEMIKQYTLDPLRHDKISPCLYLGMLEAFEVVKANAQKITTPTLMLLSGADKIVSTPASLEFFENLGAQHKEVHIYSDSYHEIINDLEKDRVFHDLKVFLNQF